MDKSDLFSPFDDGCAAPKVGVSGCDVVNALMVTLVVVMIDEGADLVFEIARQVVVLQQDPVLQRLVPAFDLTLCLRVVWRATDMVHFLVFQPIGKIAGDVGRAVIAEQPRLVDDVGAVAT